MLWQASYLVGTTTIQDILLNQNVFATPVNSTGDVVGDSTVIDRAIDLPTLTNDIITSKRAQLLVSAFTAKNILSFGMYNADRTYEIQTISQKIFGGNLFWGWRFSKRDNSMLTLLWQQTDTEKVKSDISLISWRLSRQFSQYMSAFLELRHLKQNGGMSLGVGNSGGYTENRVTASIYVTF
jgi:uncharacterized protein (PEP-CTERM system associated)